MKEQKLDILFFTSNKGKIPYFELAVKNLSNIKTFEITHREISKWHFLGFKNIPFKEIMDVAVYKTMEHASTETSYFMKFRWKLLLPIKFLLLMVRFLNYTAAFHKHPSFLVGVWNGLKERSAIAALVAKHLGRRVVFSEIGVMPNTTVFDAKGITAYSSIPKEPFFYKENKFEKKYGLIPDREIEIRQVHKDKNNHDLEKVELPKNYIFVPFQQVDDSSILIHSANIKSMVQLFDWIKFVVDNSPSNIKFVLKEHPSEKRTYQSLHSIIAKDRVIFANSIPTPILIKNSSAIITINSMVGMEGLISHKKIISLGDSWYNFYPLSYSATSKEELLGNIKLIPSWQVDTELIESFLSYIYYEYSLPNSYHSSSSKHWEKMAEKIKIMIKS